MLNTHHLISRTSNNMHIYFEIGLFTENCACDLDVSLDQPTHASIQNERLLIVPTIGTVF